LDPVAASRLNSAIGKKLALLRTFPLLAELFQRVAEGDIREAQVGNYRVFYLVISDDALIKILRIQHASMDERYFEN